VPKMDNGKGEEREEEMNRECNGPALLLKYTVSECVAFPDFPPARPILLTWNTSRFFRLGTRRFSTSGPSNPNVAHIKRCQGTRG